MAKHRRDWEAAEWQGHARRLVQRRHGAVNVQSVPDEVQGDCGIEFYSLDGTAYQCYAPEKDSAVNAAASAMKAKAGRDLGKLAKHRVADGDLEAVLIDKLQRAHPKDNDEQIDRKKQAFVNAHARRESVLARMGLEQPELWERAMLCINGEERRLEATGAVGDVPIAMVRNSIDRIEGILQHDVAGVARATIQEISMGTVADWLMRCPLDFPRSASSAG